MERRGATFGEEIRRLRLKCRYPHENLVYNVRAQQLQSTTSTRLTQEELAFRCNYSVAQVNKIEKGLSLPPRDRILHMIGVFAELGGLKTVEEADYLLRLAHCSPLTPSERAHLDLSEARALLATPEAATREIPLRHPFAACLEVVDGPHKGAQFRLDRAHMVIGRGLDAEVRLDDPTVSRHNSSIRLKGGRHWVADLGSLNGTLLNGELLAEETVLFDGDVLTVGETTLRYRCEAAQRPPGRPE